MKSKCFSGIGSRSCPEDICLRMTQIASYLKDQGYYCRTGGAEGADLAFAKGSTDKTILYLPWRSYNYDHYQNLDCIIGAVGSDPRAYDIAKGLHPAWDRCSPVAKDMHARNCHIINGKELMSPSEFVILWTPGGESVGGTALGWSYALKLGIPVLNLYNKTFEEAKSWIIAQQVAQF